MHLQGKEIASFENNLSLQRTLRILVTSVSSDSHTWNLVYMQLLLEEMGHSVVNLGSCAPDDLIIAECERVLPDLVVVSTVNGHGHIDGERLIAKIRARAGLADLPVVIGGKLGIRGADNTTHVSRLADAGFDAVFEASGGMVTFEAFVHAIASRPTAE